MKVTTEGCIFGAWIGSNSPKRILDIGTGTGLLSLMLAQKYDCTIDAVEIDKTTASQAESNFQNSKWKNRLTTHSLDINDFVKKSTYAFDLIVSNPPFFNSNFRSNDSAKNLAVHDESLSQAMLLNAIKSTLTVNGKAFILYPEYEANQIMELVEQYGLYAKEALIIKNKPGTIVFRKIIELTKSTPSEKATQELHIRTIQNEFSQDYTQLLRPFYLHL